MRAYAVAQISDLHVVGPGRLLAGAIDTASYARRADGTLAVVARSRDPLPGGEWLIFPLTVSSSASGEVWFTAYTWNNGVESLGLYLATPL